MKIKLKHASDIHLEVNRSSPLPIFIKAQSPEEMLILNGDIVAVHCLRPNMNDAKARGIKDAFVRFCDQIVGYQKIFFIFGNHEHYGGGIFMETKDVLRKFFIDHGFNENQYIILDNNLFAFDDKKTILVGSTLWTDMKRNDPMAHACVGYGMNDFRGSIYYDRESLNLFTTEDAYREHMKAKEYISAVCKEFPKHRIIMATHHCPSYQSNGREYQDSRIIDGYCSDMEDFILEHENITDWLHGHTHVNVDYHIGRCHVTSNMRGYVGYDASAVHFTKEQFNERYIEV